MKKSVTIILTALYFIAMIILTIIARPVHDASLVKVTAAPLSYENFLRDGGNGEMEGWSALAIDNSELEGDIFVVTYMLKNGERRTIVRKAQVVTGASGDGYTEIISGIGYGEEVVVFSDGELEDGQEVKVVDSY